MSGTATHYNEVFALSLIGHNLEDRELVDRMSAFAVCARDGEHP